MRINQVEELVGITKVNIRFYEKEGLLTPGRNSENGYREYSQEDVEWLKKIKLLRMLEVPIEEIRRLKSGVLTLEDAMGRHLIQLERRRANLDAVSQLCAHLRERRCRLDSLDADGVLAHMGRQEQEGTRFMDVTKQDRKKKYAAPIVAAAVMLALMGGLVALFVWAFTLEPGEAPLALVIALIAVPVIVMVGVLLALYQRIRQIRGGEEDAASKY